MKIDFKGCVIIILGVALIISLFFGQRNTINPDQNKLDELHKQNKRLLKSNDSINHVNQVIDIKIKQIQYQLVKNDSLITASQQRINDLTQNRNQTKNYVKGLTANGVGDELEKYLQKK